MPVNNLGASIWLIPAEGSELDIALRRIIKRRIPNLIDTENVPPFIPHLTLTSDIPTELDPQAIIAGIDVGELPEVRFEEFQTGSSFFTRAAIYTQRTPSLDALALQCRQKYALGGQTPEEAETWLREKFRPHVSLLYAKMISVPENIFRGIEQFITDASIGFVPYDDEEEPTAAKWTGWTGGRLAYVATNRPINEWAPSVTRRL